MCLGEGGGDVYLSMVPAEARRGCQIPWAWSIGSCELPDMGDRNQILIFSKISMQPSLLNQVTRPSPSS